ncbi:hypothetical protein AVEN_227785-1 [Araneus ventricosus]|uniref:Uncharacterized protein n=1 Tax=Araneus ventricosus TaxID=182803 RepID=A0A4Y2VQ16_ARAVE|nr:hypothetical protein AVEN_227785-1 [Araneus ventricosus]
MKRLRGITWSFVCSARWESGELSAIESAVTVIIRKFLSFCVARSVSKLRSFLTENENLMKQPPDATSSSNSDPDFSPSSRPQTYGLRSSRGSIPRTLISPPTSI